MESALIRPSLPSYTAITPTTRAQERTPPATETELPARNTVNPSDDSTSTRRGADNSRQQEANARSSPLQRENYLDPESDSYVYQAKDSETGEVVQQIPSESLRRIRAYEKTIAEQTAKDETSLSEQEKLATTA